MRAFIKLIRLPNLLIIAFTQYMVRWALIYPILNLKGLELQMPEFDFFLLVLATMLIAAGGYIINDYFDAKIDRVNRPDRMIVYKHFKRRWAMTAHVIITTVAVAIGIWVAYRLGLWKLGIIFFICSVGLWYYSITFKYQFLIGNLLIALFTALVPLIAGTFELLGDYHRYNTIYKQANFIIIWYWIFGISIFAFLTTLIREILKDMEDIEGDKEFGCKTIPIVLGKKAAKAISIVFILVAMTGLGYLQRRQYLSSDMKSFFYFLVALQLPFAFLIFRITLSKEKKDFHFDSTILKGIMLLGISYLFIFAYTLITMAAHGVH